MWDGVTIPFNGRQSAKDVHEVLQQLGYDGDLQYGDVWLTDSSQLKPGNIYRFTPPIASGDGGAQIRSNVTFTSPTGVFHALHCISEG
jgi:hypothetical protein